MYLTLESELSDSPGGLTETDYCY